MENNKRQYVGYYSAEEDWDIETLELVNSHLEDYLRMLPGGMDMTLTELQEMASRQQQQIESQQQVLVAKEQRLKYLKQQEQRHSHLSAEQDRLRRLRDKVETQELKLKKLRALRGQVEQHKATNGNLNSELDTVKALFNEKEKELTMAVAKVEQLTRQLEEIRNGKINGINGDTQTAAVLELEKLRKELLHRNKLNEQQNNRLSAQRELLQHKKDEMSHMDVRIQELQQRIKKKKSQQAENQKQNLVNQNKNRPTGTNIAAVEPYIQVVPKDNVKDDFFKKPGFEKKDSKYQALPTNTKFKSGESKPADDYPTKPPDRGKELNNNSRDKPQPVPRVATSLNNNESKPQNNNENVPSSNANQPVSTSAPTRPSVAHIAAKFSARPFGSTYSTSVLPGRVTAPPPQQQPVISITEEERQAGSGQSSPASSDSSQNSPGSKSVLSRYPPGQTTVTSQKVSQPVPASAKPAAQQQSGQGPPVSSNSVPHPARRSAEPSKSSPNQSPQHNSPRNGSDNSLDVTDSAKFAFDSPLLEKPQPQATSTPVTNTSGTQSTVTTSQAGAGKPTYRYASKNAIMNTYMSRLGSAAMQKYQQNMNKLYQNMSSKEEGGEDQAVPSDGSPRLEQRTAFNQPMSGGESSSNNGSGQTHFGLVALPQYQSIASDKGSYRLNTPKHIRRRQSDSDNEDLSKLLHGGYDRHGANQKINSGVNNQSSALDTVNQSESETNSANSRNKTDSVQSKPPQPPPTDGVVRRKKTNLKKDKSRKSGNRVSFDPLALLLDASLEGEIDLVRRTAREVQDVSAPNDEGITALHNAICAGHYEIVVFLVEFGCDVNSPDSDGWTPLHCAASCNNLPMVKFLVEHGACIFATTISDHETAAEKCEEDEDGYDGCSDYLYSIQEKLGIMNNGETFGVFDYDATNADELSFRIGDKLVILRKGDEREKEWWWARLSDKEGYIPRNLLGIYPRVLPSK